MKSATWASAAAILAFTSWATVAVGQRPVGGIVPQERGGVSLELLVDRTPLQTVSHQGKTYLPVRGLGEEYVLRVRNQGERRVLAILSVDGLNVLSGRRAALSIAGYLVGPGESVTVSGWRRSLDTVAAFRFTAREDSYAARMGRSDDIGVIRLKVIEERRENQPLRITTQPVPLGRPAAASTGPGPAQTGGRPSSARVTPSRAPAPGASRPPGAGAAVGGTGTAYGRDLSSSVVLVPFERGREVQSIALHYDTVDALRRAGILEARRPPYRPTPRPASRPIRRQLPEFAPPPPAR